MYAMLKIVFNKNMDKYSIWSILLVLFVFLLFFASLGFVCTHWTDWQTRGTFGDSFGALNALFSGLAFAGLIVTLIMQKEELGMQREELNDAKQELRQQSIEFKKQNKTLNLQRFENTFFNMLNLQETITRNLNYDCSDGGDPFECDGRMVFNKFYTYKMLDFEENIRGIGMYLQRKGLHQYSRVPDIEVFDHYFRHLYRIFKFVNESPLIETEEERYDYACIVRSQLSEYELLMLFYNSLQEENAKFKILIEKFAVFNNLRREKLASRDNVQLYDDGAFSHR